jgi:hypothetical protein
MPPGSVILKSQSHNPKSRSNAKSRCHTRRTARKPVLKRMGFFDSGTLRLGARVASGAQEQPENKPICDLDAHRHFLRESIAASCASSRRIGGWHPLPLIYAGALSYWAKRSETSRMFKNAGKSAPLPRITHPKIEKVQLYYSYQRRQGTQSHSTRRAAYPRTSTAFGLHDAVPTKNNSSSSEATVGKAQAPRTSTWTAGTPRQL